MAAEVDGAGLLAAPAGMGVLLSAKHGYVEFLGGHELEVGGGVDGWWFATDFLRGGETAFQC